MRSTLAALAVVFVGPALAAAQDAPPASRPAAPGSAPAAPLPRPQLLQLLRDGKFDELERQLSRRAEAGRREQDFASALDLASQWIEGSRGVVLPLLDAWCERSPRSYLPFLVRGRALKGLAWDARGSDWAKSVPQASLQLFGERLAAARVDLERACALDEKSPAAAGTLVTVAMGQGNEAAGEAAFAKAVARDPLYVRAYEQRLMQIMPKWGGTAEGMLAFARASAKAHPEEPGLRVLVVQAHEELARHHARDAAAYLLGEPIKAEIDEALEAIVKAYPRATGALTLAADTAALRGDGKAQVAWLVRAVAAGEKPAAFRLSELYRGNQGIPADPVERVKWLEISADAGNVHAQTNLAACYLEGIGTPKDPAKGVRLLRAAADAGDALAWFNLATCYFYAKGVEKDQREAVRWLERSAEAGHDSAQFVLGGLYRVGLADERGVTIVRVDPEESKRWFEKAAAQGHKRAREALDGR